jgi:hypothetical protein
MPWDITELRVATVADGVTAVGEHRLVAGGNAADSSVLQPTWHPSGSALYFIDDSSGYYNLRRVPAAELEVAAAAPPSASPRAARETDFGGSAPGWQLGQQGYTFLADGRVAATITDKATGESRLLCFEDGSTEPAVKEYGSADGLPHSFGGICASKSGTLYMLGGAPSEPAGVFSWALPTADGEAQPALKLASSSSATVPEGYVSTPTPIEFPCPLGTSHGYYYAPLNGECVSSEAAPPLLVKAHGGPTACTSSGFNPGIQFWTSRGFAVLDGTRAHTAAQPLEHPLRTRRPGPPPPPRLSRLWRFDGLRQGIPAPTARQLGHCRHRRRVCRCRASCIPGEG